MGDTSNNKKILWIIAAFMGAVVLSFIFYIYRHIPPVPQVATDQSSLSAPSDPTPAGDLVAAQPAAISRTTPAPAVPGDVPTVDIDTASAPVPQPAETEAVEPVEETVVEQPIPDLIAPTFDVVRVEDDGSALIAGQAQGPGEVVLLLDDADLASTPVTGAEQFVIFANLPIAAQPQVLQLETRLDDGRRILSDQRVFLAPRAAPEVPVAEAAPEVADTPAQAPQVLLADDDGVRVLASPTATVALDTISYDLEGEVAVGGRASGDGFVRVYLDNKPITTSRIRDNGSWNTALPNVDTGTYTLRVDELNEDGTVTSRVETPFKRESPATLEAFLEPGSAFNVKEMTVQPGTTLWAMAVAKYGDGSQFLKVFEANKKNIKDPNMIFPGQIFDLPD